MLLAFIQSGCDKLGEESAYDDSSTWRSIQTRIITPQCANCHVAGSSFAQQSGLILTENEAYDALVSTNVRNSAAKKDGLEMIGTQGLPSLYRSYFWEKINTPDQDHFYNDHPYYGSLMPMGSPSLTNGELELIRQWIVAGAPKTGKVADLKLLDNETRYEAASFKPLEKPENGYQIHLSPFEVAPNFDREFFIYQNLGNESDIYVNKMQFEMRPGSHHFLLYTFRSNTPTGVFPQENVVRDIKNPDGSYNYLNMLPMQYHLFFGGTQWPRVQYTFPEGVALKIPKGQRFDLNSHYVNRGSAAIPGEVYVNLHTIEAGKVTKVAQMLDLNNTDIYLPPKQTTTIEKTYTMSKRTNIMLLFSHAHQRMTEFKVFVVGGARDGQMIYYANDWEHPPILQFDTPLILEAGQALKLQTTYKNDTNNAISFGLRAEDEMMILFGYYY